jgi:hypothetical protein
MVTRNCAIQELFSPLESSILAYWPLGALHVSVTGLYENWSMLRLHLWPFWKLRIPFDLFISADIRIVVMCWWFHGWRSWKCLFKANTTKETFDSVYFDFFSIIAFIHIFSVKRKIILLLANITWYVFFFSVWPLLIQYITLVDILTAIVLNR